METILYVIHHTYYSIINLALILFIFLLTFALFGLQIFKNKMLDVTSSRFIYFGTLSQALISVFDIITFDNWYSLMVQGVRKGFFVSIPLFIFSSIFFGSYLLLNLFMAIVLEGFEYATAIFETNKENNLNNKTTALSPKNKSISRKVSKYGVQRISTFASQIMRLGKRKQAFIFSREDKSLGIFSKFGLTRRFCSRLIAYKSFKIYLLTLYLMHAILMGFETYYSGTFFYHGIINPTNNNNWSDKFELKIQFYGFLAINFCWFIEIMVKIIKNGLIMNEDAYLRSFFNCIDFFSVWLHLIDWLVQIPFFYEVILLF